MAAQETVRHEPKMVPQDPLSAVLLKLGYVFAAMFILVALFTLYEVVMRYFFNAPTVWVHETTIAMSGLCFAFGGAYCLGADRHIRVVLIYDAVSPAARRWFDIAIALVGAAAAALMAWAAYDLAHDGLFRAGGGFRLETTGSAWNPPTPALVKVFLFVILCVMCVQFALQALRHLRRRPQDETPGGVAQEEVAGDV